MAEYEIEITETLSKTITIKAESYTEAIKIAREKYNKEEIVLDSSNFCEVDFISWKKSNN